MNYLNYLIKRMNLFSFQFFLYNFMNLLQDVIVIDMYSIICHSYLKTKNEKIFSLNIFLTDVLWISVFKLASNSVEYI